MAASERVLQNGRTDEVRGSGHGEVRVKQGNLLLIVINY